MIAVFQVSDGVYSSVSEPGDTFVYDTPREQPLIDFSDGGGNVYDNSGILICLFCCFTSQVNSYGHGGTVSSPNHTLFLGKLEQAVNQYFEHILSLVTYNNPS